jgi:hypothetical protein
VSADFEMPEGWSDNDWYAAVQEARTHLARESPHGVDAKLIGHRAWRQLTPVQQAHALDALFAAYIVRLHDEERAAQLNQADQTVKTFLQGDEEHALQQVLGTVRPITEDTTVRVSAADLVNILDELDLVRHRLDMARREDEKDGGQTT